MRAISISSTATIRSLVNGGTIDGNIDITSGAQVNVEINNSGVIDGKIYISDYSYTFSRHPSLIVRILVTCEICLYK